MQKIDGILMASGFSMRFGKENKLLSLFKGRPLAEYTLKLALSLNLNKVIFVTASNRVKLLAKDNCVCHIKNEHPEKGVRESIRLGVMESNADHFLFFTCDQPLLDYETVRLIIDRAHYGKIIVPYYRNTPGNPVLFSSSFKKELIELKNGESARILKNKYKNYCIKVNIKSKIALLDVDTINNMKELEKL